MLHTLNKAWTTILGEQINSGAIFDALFITYGHPEYITTECLLDHICGLKGCWIFDEEDVVYGVSVLLNDKMFDDVLVSHEVTDPMLHDYLAKHCRRIIGNVG